MFLEAYKNFIEFINIQNINEKINGKIYRNNFENDETGILIYSSDTGNTDSLTHYDFVAGVYIFHDNYEEICEIADDFFEFCKKHFEKEYKEWLIGQFYPVSNPSLPFKEIGLKQWQVVFDIRIFLTKL